MLLIIALVAALPILFCILFCIGFTRLSDEGDAVAGKAHQKLIEGELDDIEKFANAHQA